MGTRLIAVPDDLEAALEEAGKDVDDFISDYLAANYDEILEAAGVETEEEEGEEDDS